MPQTMTDSAAPSFRTSDFSVEVHDAELNTWFPV
jgi:hypothetical protein